MKKEQIQYLRNCGGTFSKIYGVVCFAMAWLMLFSLTSAFAETKVSGTISTNTTWTKAGSPYIVTGSITVKTILNIEPGSEIKFEKGTGFTISSGSLIAKGTQISPIRFTSNAASPAPGDWSGIYFGSYTKEATLEYCTVEYGGFEEGYNICAYITNYESFNFFLISELLTPD